MHPERGCYGDQPSELLRRDLHPLPNRRRLGAKIARQPDRVDKYGLLVRRAEGGARVDVHVLEKESSVLTLPGLRPTLEQGPANLSSWSGRCGSHLAAELLR